MKKILIIIIAAIVIYIAFTYSKVDSDEYKAPIPAPVNQEQALEIAKKLSNNIASPDIKFYMMRKRREFPPLSNCYLFQVPLGVDYPDEEIIVKDPEAPGGERKTIKHWGPMYGYIWVEADTGRIVMYQTSTGYMDAKNADRPLVSKNDLISRDDAIKIAEQVTRKTNIDMRGMKLTNDGLSRNEYYKTNVYFCCWSLFKEIEGVRSVRMPENLSIQLDAETGEVIDIFYKKYEFDMDLIHPPLISKEEAIKTAVEAMEPKGKYELIKADLTVSMGEPPYLHEGELIWEVVILEEGEKLTRNAKINADTGKVLGFAIPNSINIKK